MRPDTYRETQGRRIHSMKKENTESTEYKTKSVVKIAVEFNLTQHHVDAIDELLEEYRKYESKEDGRRPFANYSFKDVFRMIMEVGSYHDIDNHIVSAQFRRNMITTDQLISNGGMKTVAEWEEEERQQEGQ